MSAALPLSPHAGRNGADPQTDCSLKANTARLRAGLEDAPFGESRSNAQLIADMVRKVEAAGGRPASVAEVRAGLAAIALAGRS